MPVIYSAYLLHTTHGADAVIIQELDSIITQARELYLSVADQVFGLSGEISEMEWERTQEVNEWDGDPVFDELQARYQRAYDRAETLFRSLRDLEIRMMERDPNFIPTANTFGYPEPEGFRPYAERLNRQ